jgi:uncharacterized protein (DUF2252 family)
MATVGDGLAVGREMRRTVARSAHAEWTPPGDRPDVVDFLREADRGRLVELLPVRYQRMAASPFAFFRGSAALMARDLSSTPTTGWHVQASGDAHVANFGAFATPERELVFDLNDFDETSRGPWEWDLKRFAASVILLGRENRVPGGAATDAVLAMVRSYRTAMRGYARSGYLAVFYAELEAARVLNAISTADRTRAERDFRRADRRDDLGALAKLAAIVDGRLRIIDRPPLVTHSPEDDVLSNPEALVSTYRSSLRPDVRELLNRYTYVDAARKVVGVGSVGTRCFIVLLMGRDTSDPLFLQVKEARRSVLEPYVGDSTFTNNGQRVVVGQHHIQAASDIFLGWGEHTATHYYVRQLQDKKGGAQLTKLGARSLSTYAALRGWALARAHARSGDPQRHSGYVGSGDTIDQAIARFAVAYANQTQHDHATFVTALGLDPSEQRLLK